MTQVHRYSKVDFASVSFFFQTNLLFVYTLSSWQAWIVSSFFYSFSSATFASGIHTACCIHRNTLVCQIVMVHWAIPFAAMWSSWSFNRGSSICGLVDPWDSTLQAYCVFWKLVGGFKPRHSFLQACKAFRLLLERNGRFHMHLQLLLAFIQVQGVGVGACMCVSTVSLLCSLLRATRIANQVTRDESYLNPLTWHSAENGARKRARPAGMTCTHKRFDVSHKH